MRRRSLDQSSAIASKRQKLCARFRALFAKNDSHFLRCTGVGADIFANARAFPFTGASPASVNTALTFVPTVCTGTKMKTAIRVYSLRQIVAEKALNSCHWTPLAFLWNSRLRPRAQSADNYEESSEAIIERSVGPLKLYRSAGRNRALACGGSNLWRSRNALEDLTLVAPRSDRPRANPGECALSTLTSACCRFR
jgi:hypothetical protein